MIKLVPAKCPSCGANLELDDNLKRTECEFCKTTIVVDEAIQKYQVELKGKVRVSKDYSNEIETAKKYIKLKEYDNAKRVIENILDKDELNLEALRIKAEFDIEELSIYDFNFEKESAILDLHSFMLTHIEHIIYDVNRISILDENKDFVDFTTQNLKELNEKKRLVDKFLKKKQELIDKCNSYIYKPTFKCHRLLKVLETLGFDKGKIKKDFGGLKCYDNSEMFYKSDGNTICSPKIDNIGYHTAIISCTSILNNYKQTRNNSIDFDEQIKLIDKLIETDNESLFSRLLGK